MTEYRVKLGLAKVVVQCRSKDEATRLARTVYDVIQGADDQGFQIDEIEADSSL